MMNRFVAIVCFWLLCHCVHAQKVVYGNICGAGASKPSYRVLLEKAVVDKDTIVLNSWLTSKQKELNAYGVEGYFIMKADGFVIPKATLSRIKKIKKSHAKINGCAGCFIYKEPLKDLLARFEF